ncbi:type 2C protein phosphatase [Saccharomycopsis crataegensis]|uniref:Type 2C protein phosphatase n=1 Tax=Saccharomycopsis crataegensis TaxID=43959 RepID=A0AAV5QQ40_9ASCO|nr:type 2C protein phosphatase [Saccharomycopsis crataegensis]
MSEDLSAPPKSENILGKIFHKKHDTSSSETARSQQPQTDNPQEQRESKKLDQQKDSDEAQMSYKLSYTVGVSENKNSKYRLTMEDVHTYVANFVERLDWGYFAVFDGHAGKSSAKWCGQNLHLLLEKELLSNEQKQQQRAKWKSRDGMTQEDAITTVDSTQGFTDQETEEYDKDVRDCLDSCFQQADKLISQSTNNIGTSGCTAAVAIMRWELDDEYQDKVHSATTNNYKSKDYLPEDVDPDKESKSNASDGINRKSFINQNVKEMQELFDFLPSANHKRMLYTANVGDSRLVLCRSGYAIRLSYDHKGSDVNEGNRIIQAGGLIMKNRVNGVLAITRSLGDTYLKNLIIGRPYTTAIEINEHDEFLILACDGLWDVLSDQEAVDLIREEPDPNKQSKILVDHAMKNLSTDNITVMVIRFDKKIFTK